MNLNSVLFICWYNLFCGCCIDGRKDLLLLLEGSQVWFWFNTSFWEVGHVYLFILFLGIGYLIYSIQEATKRAQEKMAERVRCLEDDLGKAR